jgi:hypothetical protein
MEKQKLLFIYNANSGARNAILDSAHKIFSPNTYQCSLCDLTFGVFTENKSWKKFKSNAGLSMEFLHKDEFSRKYKSKFGYKFSFPIVLVETNDRLEVFITTKELDALNNVENLIKIVQGRIL